MCSPNTLETSNEIGRTALRKAARHILPLIAVGYCIAFMERVNVGYAQLPMSRALHFSPAVYGLGAGLFFVSYALCGIPSNLMLYRFGARSWLSRIIIAWGVVAAAMLFVRTPGEFYAARILLGIAEAGFFPGAIYYLSQWFPAELRARAISRFYIAFPLSSVVMGLIAAPLLRLDGRLGLAGWQWLFLLEGLPAVAAGVIFLVYLPDSPAQATWLSQPEREAILALNGDFGGNTDRQPKAILPVVQNPQVWLLGLVSFCTVGTAYAALFSAPAVLRETGHYSTAQIGGILSVINLLGAAAMWSTGSLSNKPSKNYRINALGCIIATIGFVIAGLSATPALVIFGLLLIFAAFYGIQGSFWVLCTNGLEGKPAAVGISIVTTISVVGGFAGPYGMGIARNLTGDYHRGLLLMTVPNLVAIAILLYLAPKFLSRNPVASFHEPRGG